MAGPGTEARDVKAWNDQDLTEAFLLIRQGDASNPLDQDVLSEMNRRALGGGRHAELPIIRRSKLWNYGQDHP